MIVENIQAVLTGNTLQIQGFPDAIKVIQLSGHGARRLSHLMLHLSDLEFAKKCLEEIDPNCELISVVNEALWTAAIVRFIKCYCFSKSRFQLSTGKTLRGTDPSFLVAYKYFYDLRSKHLVHDENAFSQGLPYALLNDGNKPYKIEKVVCAAHRAVTLEPGNLQNLKLLIEKSLNWVTSEADMLFVSLGEGLEALPYKELYERGGVRYVPPQAKDMSGTRP